MVLEREFQNLAKLRLNSLFASSSEGAHRTCVLFGIVANCRARGIYAPPHDLDLRTTRYSPRLYGLDAVDVTSAAFVAAKECE